MEHPKECMRTNVMGFQNVIHAFRNCPRFLYASSSSVYGNSTPPLKSPDLGTPLSPYAASKQANESLAGAYHKAFGLDVLGLRFFSVYGPWGRPDMAAFIFIEKLLAGEPVQLFNNGEMFRDWTYINDVAAATARLLIDGREVRSRVVNVAGCRSEKLVDFFQILRDMTGSLSNVDLQPMQKGDIHTTEAGDTVLDDLDICPTSLQDGLRRFVEWHRGFYPEKWENVAQERAD
jgi:UDP-glucuronate 4-epimerase